MKNKIIIFIIAIVLVITIIIFLNVSKAKMPKEMPRDFGFIYRFNTYGKDIVNTFEGTFTKDLVEDGQKTIKMTLNEGEIKEIYQAMRKINIINYPNKIKENVFVEPPTTCKLIIRIDGDEKEILWDNALLEDNKNNIFNSKKRNLSRLFIKIQNIVRNKDEYKKLPKPNGGYN